jgi:PAS domain-containing protein
VGELAHRLIVGGGFLYAMAEAYYRFRGQEGLGMGDVKLLAMIGAFLGWKLVLLTLVFASLTGSLAGGLLIASGRGSMKYALPFGTFLAVGALFAATGASRSRTGTSASTSEAPGVRAARHYRAGRRACRGGDLGLLRFVSAARDTRHRLRDTGDSPLLSVALQDAVQKLRAQERAMTERAEASEALSTQIVNSLTAGLLVVDREGLVRIINPAGTEVAGISGSLEGTHISALSRAAAPLAAIVSHCLATGEAIVRRTVQVPHANDVTHLGVTATRLSQSEGNAAGGVICLFSDLTAVIALEEQLRLKERSPSSVS